MELLLMNTSGIQTLQLKSSFFPSQFGPTKNGSTLQFFESHKKTQEKATLRATPSWNLTRRHQLLSFSTARSSNGSFTASETSICESEAVEDEQELLLKKKADEIVTDLRGTCIFLIGMMGSGKSTVAKLLAEALGYYFFDSDKLIEEAAGGATVAEIFKEKNEESFRDAETEVLKQLSGMGRLVVGTGGGIVIRPVNWSYLRHGVTVWLDVPLEALAKRVVAVGTESRPLLGQTSDDCAYSQALEMLSNIYKDRGPSYANADATVSLQKMALQMGHEDVSTLTPTMIAIQVLEEIKKLLKHKKQTNAAAGA